MAKTRKVTFIPAIDFTGYPVGTKHLFKTDHTSIPVEESYAELMREKGLVKTATHFIPVSEETKDTK